jgi:hypothetical protein
MNTEENGFCALSHSKLNTSTKAGSYDSNPAFWALLLGYLRANLNQVDTITFGKEKQ